MSAPIRIEICVDSVESALAAQAGGADRVELCQDLFEGGITPSAGLLQTVKHRLDLDVAVMIRPRGGDFLYTDAEFEVMLNDLRHARQLGADLIVTGVLTSEGRVDRERMELLMKEAAPLPVTFHRAFDMTRDAAEALEDLTELGVHRVLTSGQESSVLEGLPLIEDLLKQAGDRILLMPGGGITERNLPRILERCRFREIHLSASASEESRMTFRNPRVAMGRRMGPPEYAVSRASVSRVKEFRAIAG